MVNFRRGIYGWPDAVLVCYHHAMHSAASVKQPKTDSLQRFQIQGKNLIRVSRVSLWIRAELGS